MECWKKNLKRNPDHHSTIPLFQQEIIFLSDLWVFMGNLILKNAWSSIAFSEHGNNFELCYIHETFVRQLQFWDDGKREEGKGHERIGQLTSKVSC